MNSSRQRTGQWQDDILEDTSSCLRIKTSLQGATRFFQGSPSSLDSSPKMVAIANPHFTRAPPEVRKIEVPSWKSPRDSIGNHCDSVANDITGLALQLQKPAGRMTKQCLPESSMLSRMWKVVKQLKPRLVKKFAFTSETSTRSTKTTDTAGVVRRPAVGAKSTKLRKRGTRVGLRMSLLRNKYLFGVRRCDKLCMASTKCIATTAPTDSRKSQSSTDCSNLQVHPKAPVEHLDDKKDACAGSRDVIPKKDGRHGRQDAREDSIDMETSLLELGGSGFQMPDILPMGTLQSILSAEFGLRQLSQNRPNMSPPILRRRKIQCVPKWLHVYPSKNLLFHYTMRRKLFTCSITLENRTFKGVAFKFMANSPFEYLIKPKQGLLGPGAKISVRLVKGRGAPSHKAANTYFSPFLDHKRDVFVISTLPIQPTSDMPKDKCLPIDASIFDYHNTKCCYEGILSAVFPRLSIDTNDADLNIINAKFWSFRRNLSLGPH